jgi:UPF0755 protein
MTKFSIITIILVIILGVLGFTGFNFYNQFYGVPKDAPKGDYSFEVKQGQTLSDLADKLVTDKVINNKGGFLLMARLNPIDSLQGGTYTISLDNSTPEQILELINVETANIATEKAKNKKPTVKITIREGLTMDQIFALLDEKSVTKATEMAEYAKDPTNFDRALYPFLPQPLTCTYGDPKTCAKYYPEGYLYPNTYEFFVPSTPKEVYTKLLNSFNDSVWSKVKNNLNGKDFTKAVIMASVLEKETGRPKFGVSDKNRDEVNIERQNMSQVFYNRLEKGMKWQSDVTAEYGYGRKLCQQTLKIDNCLFLDSPDAQTKYSTYLNIGYPIAPVTSPQYDNVFAVLNPIPNSFIYFVSDATGKKYFSTTEREFNQSIQNVKKINRDLGV